MSSESQEPSYTPGVLALPPPPPEEETEKITVNGSQTFKFDKLGPVVVNSDGVSVLEANARHGGVLIPDDRRFRASRTGRTWLPLRRSAR